VRQLRILSLRRTASETLYHLRCPLPFHSPKCQKLLDTAADRFLGCLWHGRLHVAPRNEAFWGVGPSARSIEQAAACDDVTSGAPQTTTCIDDAAKELSDRR
jgi:hypothetical protein